MVEYDMKELLDNSYDAEPSKEYMYQMPSSNNNQLTVLRHKQRHVNTATTTAEPGLNVETTTTKPSLIVETTTTEDYFLKNHFFLKH